MRHYNSPEEIAKRTGEAVEPAKRGQGFRHYNSPEEVAKRAAQGATGSTSVQRRSPLAPVVEDWPPAGEENTALVVVNDAPQPGEPFAAGSLEDRLERLERLVFAFLDSASEAREFRMLLSNQAAVTESQRDMIGRVKALEQTLDSLAADEDEDDGGTEPPPAGSADPAVDETSEPST